MNRCLFAVAFVAACQSALAQAPAAPVTPPPAASNELSSSKKNANEKTMPNGVIIETLREGSGEKPAPNATVHIQYIGSLSDGTEFDRSYSRKKPAIYRMVDVIGCWQTAIPEMTVGSKAKITCPPGSANGRRPVDFIEANTTLYFVIELIAIVG
ncbi:MAG: FKBP-type peptidyl-prolyl cis-trans isomerase [Burkholderiaceae bacterium]|jgi:FKBP-type peptidyl-prolyl cis-trans isomerase FkpA|nr:FKBP-type peptidyl-prolyl cis-trans isomerase [Burkholderiaceae bacterium]